MNAASPRPNRTPTAETRPPATPLLASQQLFSGGNTVHIEHAGQIYQLRITRENRLILTK